MLKRKFLIAKISSLALCMCLIAGCASTPKSIVKTNELMQWLEDAKQYEQSLPSDHPDHAHNILTISAPMREALNTHFVGVRRSTVAQKMANWLMADDGHNMQYNIDADLSPAQAFEQRQGNCLSFTILIATMAAELGVELLYNEVKLPDVWNQDEGEDRALVLYRHINAIKETSQGDIVFDLAMDTYDASFPQRVIPAEYAVALLHSNKAVASFRKNDMETAKHYLKLALAQNPENSDVFVNLAAVLKVDQQPKLAELALLHALTLDNYNYMAANKLERWYRVDGETSKAKKYQRLARISRNRNPYFQFSLAEKALEDGKYKTARRYIYRAKKLYDEDSRFFWLSSRVSVEQENYTRALNELQDAFKLAKTQERRDQYLAEAKEIVELVQKLTAQESTPKLRPLLDNIEPQPAAYDRIR